MIRMQLVRRRFVAWTLLLAASGQAAMAFEQGASAPPAITRQVSFKLTFANRDLVWLGDPASPTSMVYVKPGAQPIASDLQVTTLTETVGTPARHYLREARIVVQDKTKTVHAFTSNREKIIGAIDDQGRFQPNETYRNRDLLPTWPADAGALAYDADENALYYDVDVPGPQVVETLDFLPLALTDAQGNAASGRFSINFAPSPAGKSGKPAVVELAYQQNAHELVLARATLPNGFRGGDVELGSFDNPSGTYLSEAPYRAGARNNQQTTPGVTFSFAGEFTDAVQADKPSLALAEKSAVPPPAATAAASPAPARIVVDGNFDDWRNVAGVDDPRGDVVPYLEYVPDVDLLEFKVAHDDEHIYFYARVAGQIGRSHPDGGRSYFYAYMDVDQNAGTGFLPSRDDDCYFGVDIGDDCEVQFEFVDNVLRKTFYGFCGLGGNENVLRQQVALGKSQYGRLDENGTERKDYKAEYTYRNGVTEITEDLKLGTSDTIRLAISPDGREVEVVSSLAGFLKSPDGTPTVRPGQTIDVAVGLECDSKAYVGKTRWGADNTKAIRGYQLRPAPSGGK